MTNHADEATIWRERTARRQRIRHDERDDATHTPISGSHEDPLPTRAPARSVRDEGQAATATSLEKLLPLRRYSVTERVAAVHRRSWGPWGTALPLLHALPS